MRTHRSTVASGLAAVVLTLTSSVDALADQWIDAATGQKVLSGPVFSKPFAITSTGARLITLGVRPNAGDPDHAFDPETGRNFVRDPTTCIWKDAATGQKVLSGPVFSKPFAITSTGARLITLGVRPNAGDPDHAFDPETGRNFVRVKSDCKPTERAHTTTPPPKLKAKHKLKHKVAKKPPPENAVLPPVGIGIGISTGGGSGGHERSHERER